MLQLLYFILICHGLTQILAYGKIFNKIRPKAEFFHCSMCIGFWCGIMVYLLSFYSGLFTFGFSITTAFLLACLSSGTSYFLDKIVGDDGLRISK